VHDPILANFIRNILGANLVCQSEIALVMV